MEEKNLEGWRRKIQDQVWHHFFLSVFFNQWWGVQCAEFLNRFFLYLSLHNFVERQNTTILWKKNREIPQKCGNENSTKTVQIGNQRVYDALTSKLGVAIVAFKAYIYEKARANELIKKFCMRFFAKSGITLHCVKTWFSVYVSDRSKEVSMPNWPLLVLVVAGVNGRCISECRHFFTD